MKKLFTNVVLQFSAWAVFASPFAPEPSVECAVYSYDKYNQNLHVATISTNTNLRQKQWMFPSSYTGHRAACKLNGAATNDNFCAWIGGDKYVLGSPFGVSSGRNTRQIMPTPTCAITPRISLTEDDSDRHKLFPYIVNTISNFADIVSVNKGSTVRVRIARYAIDNVLIRDISGSQVLWRTLFDKQFYTNIRDYLCEADFLGDDCFDIDWGTMTGEIVNEDGSPTGTDNTGVKGAGCVVSNMTYLVVIGDGATAFRDTDDTNTFVKALATVVTRRFEVTRHKPVAVSGPGVLYSGRPTFTWAIPDEELWAKEFGSSYTAFKLQILDTNDVIVYDSGVERAPVQDANGNFTWMAPISAGSMTDKGKLFAANGNWKWRVAMYNAKFQPQKYSRDEEWSVPMDFSTAVNAQQ